MGRYSPAFVVICVYEAVGIRQCPTLAYRDLEWAITRLEQVAVSGEYHRLPRTNNSQVQARLHNRLTNHPDSFLNSLEGVKSRLDEIFQDPRLREIFNNTTPTLDFDAILDTDKQVLFDLGNLRDESAETVTAVLMITLFDALQNRDLSDKPEDYLVNLQIDEAASVVVSKPMKKFLREGREFRLCLGLMTQFSKQMQHEGTRGVYMNVLNNVRTTLASTITMDEELAESFSHEDMDTLQTKHRLRHMASGEWMLKTLNPEWDQEQPQPFNIRTMEIPPGHPESNDPLSEEDEADFQEIVRGIRDRAATEYGVVDDQELASLSVPRAVQQLLDCPDRIDIVIATAVGGTQADEGTGMDARDANEPVEASAVHEKVRAYYDEGASRAAANDESTGETTHAEHQLPSHETIVETAQNRTDLIEVEGNNSVNEARLRLTDAGEKAIESDTGNVRSSGGEAHDSALEAIERALGSEGFTVTVLEQDGSDMPDAKATHPNLDGTLILEAETTTPTKPAKVLENLKKAQRMDGIPVFVVEPGEDDVGPDETGEHYEYWARRVENILSNPVNKTDDKTGDIDYYVSDNPLRINEKVTALRPTTGDKRRTNWTREDDELVMRDGADNEHARLSSLDDIGTTDFPAVDIYDGFKDEHLVQKKLGDELNYTDNDSMKEDWVRVKQPAIPEEILPDPDYDRGDYHIVILSLKDNERPVFYRDGGRLRLSLGFQACLCPAR